MKGVNGQMARIIDAVYEDGVLKPLKPINLKEHTKVRLIVEIEEERKKKAEKYLHWQGKVLKDLPRRRFLL
jgi:predicted DNA-binding antitoxin AbrB/MazE fold protein